jgi:hypothetical protein
MDEIIRMINDDLSFEELSEITRTALSKIYIKLRNEGLYDPVALVKSLGENEWNVQMVFIDGESHNTGESYESIYYL